MKRTQIATMAFGTVLVVATSSAQVFSQPLPDNIRIVKPSASLSPEKAAFIGKWAGKWTSIGRTGDPGQPILLVIEEIRDNGNVRLVYSWGRNTQNSFSKPGFGRPNVKFVGDKLAFSPQGNQHEFSVRADGTMRGKRSLPGGVFEATLTKE